jgi:hypothetical protein
MSAAAMASLGYGAAFALWPKTSPRIRVKPVAFAITPFRIDKALLPSNQIRAVQDLLLREHSRMDYSQLLHWLRVFGRDTVAPGFSDLSAEAISLLTDDNRLEARYGAKGAIVKTTCGARILAHSRHSVSAQKASRPAHLYQAIAVFGELGLLSCSPLHAIDGDLKIRDAVHDCLTNLQLRESFQQEPEWVVQVAAHYLPPTSRWTNRWGELLAFDDVADFVLKRPIATYACGGTHLLHSLALILQADNRFGILSSSSVRRIEERFRQCSIQLEATQHADGAWRHDWLPEGQLKPYKYIDIHLTGHILESQLYLDSSLRISNRSAVAALRYMLRAFSLVEPEELLQQYCAFSHSGLVLLVHHSQ